MATNGSSRPKPRQDPGHSIQRRLLYSMVAVLVAGIAVTGGVVYRQARDEANALFDLQLRQLAAALPVRACGEVAQPMRVRSALAAEVALRTVLPLVILLPILGGLLWWVVGRGLAPLRRVAAEVAARRPEALERLPEHDLPEEVAPLVASLNRLLVDLAAARDAQRAFIADAAHELRTPLTALQLQLQVVERAADPDARRLALDALREGLARASRLVQQLLALARAEPDPSPAASGGPRAESTTAVDLEALAREAIALHAQLAHDHGIDLGFDPGRPDRPPPVVRGDRDALFTLLGNLIDNALRYTPRGGRVDVALDRSSDDGAPEVTLSVTDDGPGISPAERERVFDRFHRGDAARAAGDTRGSGLGLAIVKRIVERHGARIALDAGPLGRGLRVRVAFPLDGHVTAGGDDRSRTA